MGNRANASSQVPWWIRRQSGHLSQISLVPKPVKGFLIQWAASGRSELISEFLIGTGLQMALAT